MYNILEFLLNIYDIIINYTTIKHYTTIIILLYTSKTFQVAYEGIYGLNYLHIILKTF